MGKTRIFQVVNNRMQFKCSCCGAKRNLPVPPNLRRKSMRCHKCMEITQCQFNRRTKPREQRSGKVVMTTSGGEELMVNLNDISETGLGIDLPLGFVIRSKVKIGNMVRLKCSWNSHLTDSGNWVVKNIKERRIGLKKGD